MTLNAKVFVFTEMDLRMKILILVGAVVDR
jgi:hypothetical protein